MKQIQRERERQVGNHIGKGRQKKKRHKERKGSKGVNGRNEEITKQT